MANITRLDPFFDVDDVFRGMRMAPMRREGDMEPKMKLDVEEDDRNYTIHAEIPGAKKEDIKVTIDGNQVAISAEIKRETEKKEKGRIVHSERYYGNVYRSFSLENPVDESQGSATYKDGLLELVLPKKSGGGATKVKIT